MVDCPTRFHPLNIFRSCKCKLVLFKLFLFFITIQKCIIKSIKIGTWNLVYLLYMFCMLTPVFNVQYLIFNLNNLSSHCLLCRPNTSTSPFLSPARAILIARGWNQLLNFLFLQHQPLLYSINISSMFPFTYKYL